MDDMRSRPLPEADLLYVLRAAQGVWEGLRGQRIFITGATGFVGRWLMESLQAADYALGLDVQVVALSRDPERFLRSVPHLAVWSKLTWVRGSVATLTPETLGDRKFDSVIHLATEANLAATQADPNAAREVIAGGTLRTLEVASCTGARRFLFTSSGSVYGPQPEGVTALSENRSLPVAITGDRDAATTGAQAKRQAEGHCTDFARDRGLGVVIARCFTFAGPAMPLDGKFAFGNFLKDALAGRRIILTGDGTPMRSYMYGADLALWLWTLLIRGATGGIYNVGSEDAICLRDLAETMAHELGAPGIDIQQQPVHGMPVNRYVPSTQKARNELGLRESTGWVQSILKTADWLRH